MKYATLLIVLSAFLLVKCSMLSEKKIKGNGVVQKKVIDVSKFDEINAGDGIQVYVRQDSVYSIVLETDENLINFIDIDASYRHELVLEEKQGYNLHPTRPIKVFISNPMVRLFEASGASSITSENLLNADGLIYIKCSGSSNIALELAAENVDVDVSGTSNVKLKGNAKQVKINGSGTSTINSFDLRSTIVNIQLSGSSKGLVYADSLLIAEGSGASSINYKGGATVSKSISGASNIEKAQ